MNLDGLTLSVLIRELNEQIGNGQIQRIQQIDKTSILLKINTPTTSPYLVITVGSAPSIYVSDKIVDTPKEPTSLIMYLRKHIEGARITNIEQLHGDRIIRITADKLGLDGSIVVNEIYVELMGKYSNCIFVQNGTILESLVHVTPLMNRVRSVAPKLPYDLPPNTSRVDLMQFSSTEITQLLQSFSQDTIGNTIRHIFNGFGPVLLEDLCCRMGLTPTTPMSADLISSITEGLTNLQTQLLSAQGLLQYTTATGKRLLTPIPISESSPHTIVDTIQYDTISEALSQDVAKLGAIHTAGKELEKIIAAAIKKEEGRHEKIKAELDDTSKSDMYKSYGDLLMIYSYLPHHYESEVTVQNVLSDDGENITIPLEPPLSITENAQAYYKLYRKMKNRTKNGQYQLEQSSMRLAYLESIQYSLSLATTKQSVQEIRSECESAGILRQSKKPIPFKIKKDNFLHFTIPNGDVYVGQNNQQNEYLTNRWAKPNDLWLHTQHIQGSHVILRSDIEPDIKMIEAAAQIAAYFSKGKDTSKVTVDYTLVKHIKKPPGSPLGYVIFNTHNDIVVEPKAPEGYVENNQVN